MSPIRKAIISTALVAPTLAFANLLENGSFEFGNYNNTDGDPRPEIMLVTAGMTNITGWSAQGAGGVHWLQGAADASVGTYSLDLQGIASSQLSSISTTFATTAGMSYQLSFDSFAGLRANTATVSVGSLIAQSFQGLVRTSGMPPPYSQFLYTFTALGDSSTLTFRVTSSPDTYGPVIDNVVVVAVPEPATAALFAMGALMLAAAKRKREA